MTQTSKSRRKPFVLEMFGVLVALAGICFAIIFASFAFSEDFSEKQGAKKMQEVATEMDEMKSALTAAGIPAEQIPGLLRVHREALVSAAVQWHFLILSSLFLQSLWVASVGLTIILWSKLRASRNIERSRADAPIAA